MGIVGLDIGGTKCAVLLASDDGEIVAARRFAASDFSGTIDALYSAIEDLTGDFDEAPVFGVSCGGPLDAREGVILSPPNLPGWDEVDITGELERRFGGRAYLMNDADAGALAEWRWGAARGARTVIFCTHGTGFGAGLILDGRLYEGTCSAAGEIGHVRLAPDGPVGFGKSGSVEGFCSGGGIARLAQMRVRKLGTDPCFATDGIEAITARGVAEAARAGDGTARQIMVESGCHLGRALAILVDLLNPEVIVLGSIYVRAGDLLEGSMMEALQEEALPRSLAACRIVPSELGESIGDRAAVAVALYRTGRLGPGGA